MCPPLGGMPAVGERLLRPGPKSRPGTGGQTLEERRDVNQHHSMCIKYPLLVNCISLKDVTNEPQESSLE